MKNLILIFCLIFVYHFKSTSQNVGIGLANPTRAKLEVNGMVGNTVAIFGGEGNGISIQRNNPAVGFNHYYNAGDKYIANGFAAAQWFSAANGYIYFDFWQTGLANQNTTGLTRSMVIKPGGLVGIGNVDAHGELQFPNSLNKRKIVLWESANDNHQFYGFGIDNGTLTYQVDAPGAAHRFYAANNSSSSSFLMSIGGNKRVLIGQQEQGFKLGINTTDPLFTIEMVQAGTKGLGFINPLNGYHYWEMKSEVYSTNVSDALILYYDGSGTPKGWFRPTDGGYSANSDRRLKKDIKLMENILPKLLQLRPSSYHFKNDKSQQDCIGFIAQDVIIFFPELVDIKKTEDKEISDLHALNYSGFSVIAIRAIQEQQQIILDQQKQIDELAKRLRAVEMKKQ